MPEVADGDVGFQKPVKIADIRYPRPLSAFSLMEGNEEEKYS